MKHFEELSRIRVNESIQHGLAMQAAQRSTAEGKGKAQPTRGATSARGVRLVLVGLVILIMLTIAGTALAAGQADLAGLRAATAQYHRPEAAQADGWDLVPGLDHCFNNPGTGAMGYHYINLGLLDLTVDELQPEAMVYVPGPNGGLQLGAVEYVVPAAPWDAAGNTEPPEAFGQSFHLNAALGVYVLHAWVWKHNPSGMFEDWNPTVTCP